MSKADQRKEQA